MDTAGNRQVRTRFLLFAISLRCRHAHDPAAALSLYARIPVGPHPWQSGYWRWGVQAQSESRTWRRSVAFPLLPTATRESHRSFLAAFQFFETQHSHAVQMRGCCREACREYASCLWQELNGLLPLGALIAGELQERPGHPRPPRRDPLPVAMQCSKCVRPQVCGESCTTPVWL